jgi:hypothetical protein
MDLRDHHHERFSGQVAGRYVFHIDNRWTVLVLLLPGGVVGLGLLVDDRVVWAMDPRVRRRTPAPTVSADCRRTLGGECLPRPDGLTRPMP